MLIVVLVLTVFKHPFAVSVGSFNQICRVVVSSCRLSVSRCPAPDYLGHQENTRYSYCVLVVPFVFPVSAVGAG